METDRRLALLIDADNAEAKLLPQMLAEVSKYGEITIRRIYGDWTNTQLGSWKNVLHTHALNPVQQFSYTSGKNATDSALIIDAMDIIYTAGIDGICIVSSDSDYTRLATRTREKNLFVMGIGRRITPPAFVNACDVFVYTENLQSSADSSETEVPEPAAAANNTPKKVTNNILARSGSLLRTAFDASAQDDEGWVHLGALGNSLRKLDPGFDPRTYGHEQLSQLVAAHPRLFEVQKRKSPGGTSGSKIIYIRLKPNRR